MILVSADPPMNLSVISNATRFPDESPYNTFTMICTATVPEGVVSAKVFHWSRSINGRSSFMPVRESNVISIENHNANQALSTSVLTVTENIPGDYSYRCHVSFMDANINRTRKCDKFIQVTGMLPDGECGAQNIVLIAYFSERSHLCTDKHTWVELYHCNFQYNRSLFQYPQPIVQYM